MPSCRSRCLGCRQEFDNKSYTYTSICPECAATQRIVAMDAEIKKLRSDLGMVESKDAEIKNLLSDLGMVQSSLQSKDAEIKNLRSDLGMVQSSLQSRLQFLSPQKILDKELVHGILKSDVRIIVQDKRDESLVAHKFVLASRSSVFCKMFDANMLEGDTGTVLINDASHDVVKSVIKFCYDAEIDFISDGISAEEVVEVAHKYDIGLLQKRCEQEMSTTISCENLPKMFKIAKKFGLRDLERAASQFLKDHYDTAIANVLTEILP